MAKAVINEAGIRELLLPAGPIGRDLDRRALRVQNAARVLASGQLVNVQTGRYRASILAGRAQPDATHGLRVTIGSNVTHAILIELGTVPHRINPATKKALWWNRPGTTMRTPRISHPSRGAYSGLPMPLFGGVSHPGSRPRPVLRTALRAAAG